MTRQRTGSFKKSQDSIPIDNNNNNRELVDNSTNFNNNSTSSSTMITHNNIGCGEEDLINSEENVIISSTMESPSSSRTTTPNSGNNNNNNRTTHTAKRLSRIYRSSPTTAIINNEQSSSELMNSSSGKVVQDHHHHWVDLDGGDGDDESLSPPRIVTNSPSNRSSSSSPFKLNLSNVVSYSQQQQQQQISSNSSSSSLMSTKTTPRGRSVSEAILPNSARGGGNNEISSTTNGGSGGGQQHRHNRSNRMRRIPTTTQQQSSPYFIPPPPSQSPRSILSSISNSSSNNYNTPRSRSPATTIITTGGGGTSSPRSALTPRVTFFDESPNMPPHSANSNQQQFTNPDYIFIQNYSSSSNSNITTAAMGGSGGVVSRVSTQSPTAASAKHLQGLQIPKNNAATLGGGTTSGSKSPLAPSVYESIFGVSSKQSMMFRHSFGNEFEGREENATQHDDGDNNNMTTTAPDLTFNHKSPNSTTTTTTTNQSSGRIASPQLTPRRLAQQVTSSISSIKAKLSPRNKAEKEGFSGLVDESNHSLPSSSTDLDVFSINNNNNSSHNNNNSNSIGNILHATSDHSDNDISIIDVKSDDECSVRHIARDIDMHQVMATAMVDLKPHHLQTISGDSSNTNRDGSNLSVSPNYLLPNNIETESSCQSPPTTSQLIISVTSPNTAQNKPIHTYSTSDLTTISPGMLQKRASVGTDAEGKSVVSNHRKRQFKVRTCCGTIELSIFKLFALGSLLVNTLAFLWLAILFSLLYANQFDQYVIQTTPSLHSTHSIGYTREMMSYLTKVAAYSSVCAPLLVKYENFSYCNETTYMNKFEYNYQTLMSDLNSSKSFLSSDIVNNLKNSSYMGKDLEAYELLKKGQALSALKLLESSEYSEQYQKEKDMVVDPISSFFEKLGLDKTYEMSLLSLMGLIVVVCAFAFVVPLFIFILVCAFNRDSLHLERLNKANAVMLMDTMNNDTLRELFKKHCEYEYASENFSILEKINEYKQLCEKSFEIQVSLFDIEGNNGSGGAAAGFSSSDMADIVSSPVKRKPGGMSMDHHDFSNSLSPGSPMRRKQSSADSNRDSKRLKLFKKQFSEKDLERIEQEKYEIAFEIFTDYLDVNGDRSVNINKSLSDKVKEQMDGYAKGIIDVLSDNLFEVVELEVCVVLLDTHYRFKESLSFQKQMKIDKISKAKIVRKNRTKSLRYFQ